MAQSLNQLRSKAVERNSDEFTGFKKIVVFGPPEHENLDIIDPAKIITFDYCVYQSLHARYQENIEFSFHQQERECYDAALVYLPKSKRELDLVLAMITPMLQQGAAIYLVGEKKAGIASAAKKLDAFGKNNSKIDSAKHCQIWQVNLDVNPATFDIDDWLEVYSVTLNNISFSICSIPGVFSFGELDQGTLLLLENMFTKLKGRVLDFGCGSGVLGIYTKLINPEINLEMVDTNLLALFCSRKSVELNNLEASVYPSNGWVDVKGRVDAVVTNPPFHSGVSTEYQTTETFIQSAPDKMTKHAPFLLVANSFLKYSAIIEKKFGRCDILAENKKFRVYKAYR